MGVEKLSAHDYRSGMQRLQTVSANCFWWMKYVSHGMGF
jgi:hypothetical protein